MCSCNSGYDGDRCEMQGKYTTDQKITKISQKMMLREIMHQSRFGCF